MNGIRENPERVEKKQFKKAEEYPYFSYLKGKTQTEKIIQLAIDGLCTNGGHHKQWYLEQILLVLNESDTIRELNHEGIEEGVAP